MPEPDTIRLWDWPVRVCHWGMALLLPALWWTGEEGDIERHRWLGLMMLGLVVFRLIWGVIGSQPARFVSFLRGPASVLAYLRGTSAPPPGHNPLGGWSVAVLLGILSIQLGLGLMAQDEYGLVAGPLNHLVSFDTAETLTGWHKWLFDFIAILIGVHIAAVLFYLVVKGSDLVSPMLTGRKDAPVGTVQPPMAPIWRSLVALGIAAAITGWIAAGAPPT
jgi:cytochrome b